MKEFTGREHFLEILRKNKENLKKNDAVQYALIGQRDIGKTAIIKEFISKNKDVKSIYIDFEKISLSPESFSVEFTEQVVYYILGKKHSFEEIKKLKLPISETVNNIANELEKIKPNQKKLLEWSFSLIENWSLKENFNSILFVDEFHKILEFNNFGQIKDVLDFLNFDWKKSCLTVTSSALTEMKNISEKLNLAVEEVTALDRESVKQLVEKFIIIGEKEVDKIYALSRGVPLYVIALCNRYKEYKSIEKAYVFEVLSKQGIIHNALQFNLQESLSRARGQTLLFNILKVLSQNNPLRLTEISSKIYRSGPVTKSLVDRLVSVDIVSKKDKLFSLNPVMKFFIKNVIVLGNEFFTADKKMITEIAKEVEQ